MEVDAVLTRCQELERAKYLRAGLIAATIVNVNKKRGSPLTKPSDFIKEAPRPEDFMGLEEAQQFMDNWAAAQNAGELQ